MHTENKPNARRNKLRNLDILAYFITMSLDLDFSIYAKYSQFIFVSKCIIDRSLSYCLYNYS